MFNVGGGEMIVIFLLALVVLGPDKLPEAARKVGRVLTELRRMSQGFQDEVKSAIDVTGTAQTSPGPRLSAKPADGEAKAEPAASGSDEPGPGTPGAGESDPSGSDIT